MNGVPCLSVMLRRDTRIGAAGLQIHARGTAGCISIQQRQATGPIARLIHHELAGELDLINRFESPSLEFAST